MVSVKNKRFHKVELVLKYRFWKENSQANFAHV